MARHLRLFFVLVLQVFVLKISSYFASAVYIQMHFRLDIFMEAKTMNPL